MRKTRAYALSAALLLLTACGGADARPELTKKTRADLMGTVISISTYEQVEEETLEAAFDLVADIDARMTANSPDSEVGRINAGAGEAAAVSEDLCALVEQACALSALSGGAFDITIGPVSALWKVDGAFATLPNPADIEARLPLVDCRRVAVAKGSIQLADGMQLDLGAIAKGYACDRALELLKQRGVTSALLDFGGNIYAHGKKPDGSAWRVGIAVPLAGESGSACAVEAADLAVVTSGGYERYFEQDGVTYHHILDPKTGAPADSGLLSVTLLSPSATRADALSTACYILGLEQSLALLERLPDCEGILITQELEIHATSALRNSITVLDNRFAIAE